MSILESANWIETPEGDVIPIAGGPESAHWQHNANNRELRREHPMSAEPIPSEPVATEVGRLTDERVSERGYTTYVPPTKQERAIGLRAIQAIREDLKR